MQYSDGEIREYIRKVVREAKDTANVDTGFLKRSIKGDLIGRNKSVEFREIFYGAYNNNSRLIQIAERIMPKDITWKVIFIDEEGRETNIEGTTRTGRKIARKQISSENVSTSKIKALIKAIQTNGAKTNDTGERSKETDN
jgi:hypothetical protein